MSLELEFLVSGMLLGTVAGLSVIYNHYGLLKANEGISNDVNKISSYEKNLKDNNLLEYYTTLPGRKLGYNLLKNLK